MSPVQHRRRRLCAASFAIVALSVGAFAAPAGAAAGAGAGAGARVEWPSGGHDLRNSRSNPSEQTISPANAGRLAPRWTLATQGDVSATPAVVDGAVYFPDWGGFLTKADADTGQVIWSRRVSEYNGVANSVARSSPAVSGGLVYLGDQGGMQNAGARLLAIDAATGDLVWSTVIDSHPAAILTQSPLVHGGVVYQGVSSVEEISAFDPNYPCCTFRGSVVALDAATGAVRWRTFTVPDNHGAPGAYSGGGVWGSTPALDPKHHRLYVTSGNNYTVPATVDACQDAGGTAATCLDPNDHLDAIVALDTDTGAVVWTAGPARFDTWNGACIPGFPPNNCPNNVGEDTDFADGAHLFTVTVDGHARQVVGAGEKSGEYWAVDAATGEILWSSSVGPGGFVGGIQWGSATDGKRIYFAESGSAGTPYRLPDGRTITSGSYGALDPATGRILWQVPDPSGAQDWGAVSTANGVVYAGSMSRHLYALDAATGAVLWDFEAVGAGGSGPAVVDGTVYWGNGYARAGPPIPNPGFALYAFSVDGVRPGT